MSSNEHARRRASSLPPTTRSSGSYSATLRRRDSHRSFQRLPKNDESVVGVSLSGGGVRSAMFCSGVFKTLLEKDVSIDFLSSVSGGGFVAGSYMDWKYRENGVDHPEWHKRYFENMLRCSVRAMCRFEDGFCIGLLNFAYRMFAAVWCLGILSVFSSLSALFFSILLFNGAFGAFLRSIFDGRHTADVGSSLHLAFLAALFSWALGFIAWRMHNVRMPSLFNHVMWSLLPTLVLIMILMGEVSNFSKQ